MFLLQPPVQDPHALRRVAIVSMLALRPEGMTIRQLARALGTRNAVISEDLAYLTGAVPTIYQEDCPRDCTSSYCPHAALRLMTPEVMAMAVIGMASRLGLVRPRTVGHGGPPLGNMVL